MLTFILVPFLLALFLAVNMGGSGTAPSFSAAYGARVISKQLIPGLFGVMVFAGALLAGKEVSLTLGKGLIQPVFFTPINTSVILGVTALSIFFANLIGIPQSTSQSTVLSIAGAAAATGGLNTSKLWLEIIPTWFILPIISFVLMLLLAKFIFPHFFKELQNSKFENPRDVHNSAILKILIICASSYVAFSIGANNVANAAAPIAALTYNEMGFMDGADFLPVSILSILVVAPCFAIGSSLMGYKVTKKTGEDILKINPFQAMCISVLVATLLLLASVLRGIPTSLVQLNSAAFFAVSVQKYGVKKTFRNKTVARSFMVWALAPAFAFVATYLLIRIIQ